MGSGHRGAPSAAVVAETMERLYVGAPGAKLRLEDERKAIEVAAMLGEMGRVLARGGRETPVIVDAAAGKCYLGLLAASLLLEDGQPARIVSIEREPARAATARALASRLARADEVEIRVGDVSEPALWPPAPLLVTALHACGPAADTIIDRTIACGARALLLVPCCTGGAVPALEPGARMAGALGFPRHAAVRRRFLQAYADAERTLRLEAAGYETEVVELCPPTVTPHNLLWRARRVAEPRRMAEAAAKHRQLLTGPDRSPAV